MTIRPAKKPSIEVRIAVVVPQFKPFKTLGKPYIIKGRLRRGNP